MIVYSESSVLRSFDVKKFRLAVLGENKKFGLRKSNLHIGGLVVRKLFLTIAARVRFPVKPALKKSSDFLKCAFRVARTRDRSTEGQALYQLRQTYSWVKASMVL